MGNNAVSGHMQKARSNLKSAQILLDNEMYDSAVTASYYAVFHAVSALLADKDMSFNKHKTVINKYNEVFINTGAISSLSFRSLNSLFRRRLESEYDPTNFAGKDGAKEALQLAQSALQDIFEYCKINNVTF